MTSQAASETSYLKHDLMERVIHWAMALSCITLIVTGLAIRFPGILIIDEMNCVRFYHFVSMYVLICSFVAHLYHTLTVEFKNEIFCFDDLKKLPQTIKYYLFISKELPEHTKYNPLQKLSYNFVWVLILLQILTGAPMYWPDKLFALTEFFGGIMAVRVLHDFITYIFISFLIAHVYLVLSEDIKSLWAMITGYYEKNSN